MSEVHYVWTELAHRSDDAPAGRIVEGFYIIDGDDVVMTNRAGVPVVMHSRKYRGRINPGQDTRAVARELTREIWRARGGEASRPLIMPALGIY
jgi:hypothetical protein